LKTLLRTIHATEYLTVEHIDTQSVRGMLV